MKPHAIPFQSLGIDAEGDAHGSEAPWLFEPRTMRVVSVHPRTGMRPAGDPFPTVCRLPATYTPQLVDGYLLAAAPDLLAACELMLTVYGLSQEAPHAVEVMRAAVAKAKGTKG